MEKVTLDQFAESMRRDVAAFASGYKGRRAEWIAGGNPDDDWPEKMEAAEWYEHFQNFLSFGI
jgi:hypothetical protein